MSILFDVKNKWTKFFGNQRAALVAVRAAAPIRVSQGTFSFIHKSIQEYCVAEAIVSSVLALIDMTSFRDGDELEKFVLTLGDAGASNQQGAKARRQGKELATINTMLLRSALATIELACVRVGGEAAPRRVGTGHEWIPPGYNRQIAGAEY